MAAYCEIAAHSAYYMFFLYEYLIVNQVFSHLGFWNGNFLLTVPFPTFTCTVYRKALLSLNAKRSRSGHYLVRSPVLSQGCRKSYSLALSICLLPLIKGWKEMVKI